jgi:AcrR family transcriptional regulator
MVYEFHHGQRLEYLVRKNGSSISDIAKELNMNRKVIYNHFNQQNLRIELLLQYVKVLRLDLSEHFPELLDYKCYVIELMNNKEETITHDAEAEIVQNKYLDLLEKYNALLRTYPTVQ